MKEIPDVPVKNAECTLLFPFHHRFVVLKQAEKVENWKNWLIRLNLDEKKDIQNNSLCFQPHIRELLFPEMNPPMKIQSTQHLTFMFGNEPFSSDFTIQTYEGSELEKFEGHISFIDVFLFNNAMGILVININPKCDSLHQLSDFLQTLKVILPIQDGLSLPHLNLSVFPNSKKITSMNDLINFLLENLIDLESFLGINGKKYTNTSIGKKESERCHTFVYAQVLDNENISNNKIDNSDLEIKDLWLYKIGMINSDRNAQTLTDEYVEKIVNEYRIDFLESCQGIASNNNVTFLEFVNNTESIETPLSNNIKKEYFFLYIYCVCQKIMLLRLQDNLINTYQYNNEYEEYELDLQELLIRMAEFQDRFWFADVVKDSLVGEIYKKYQCALGTKTIYDCVNDKINNLYRFYGTLVGKIQLNQSYRLNRIIGIISAVLGIPILFISFLNINIRNYTSKDGLSLGSAIALLLGFIILGIGIAFLINWWSIRKQNQGKP